MNSQDRTSIGIIGAGMAGPLAAILLARRGHEVTLVEQRSREAEQDSLSFRSFNLTLTARGLAAFRKIGLEEKVKAITKPLLNRVTHSACGGLMKTSYGNGPGEILYSVRRAELNRLLIEAACNERNITFRDLTDFVDFRDGELILKDLDRDETYSDYVDYLIGADGINSKVREKLHRGRPADLKREYFDWGYKEFLIREDEVKQLGLSVDSLHVWPARQTLLVAIPNRDGGASFFLVDIAA